MSFKEYDKEIKMVKKNGAAINGRMFRAMVKRQDAPVIIGLLFARCCYFAVEPWPEDDVAIYVEKGAEQVLRDCLNNYYPF